MEAPLIEMQVAHTQFFKDMSIAQMVLLFAGYSLLLITSGKLVNYTITTSPRK